MIWSDMFATRGGTSCEQHTRWDRRAGTGARSRFATNIKQLTTPHVANRLKFVLSVVASMLANHPHRPVHRWIQAKETIMPKPLLAADLCLRKPRRLAEN